MSNDTHFTECLQHLLKLEGGKSWRKEDLGGKTAYGITQSTYTEYLSSLQLPDADVFSITQPEVEFIYKNNYWNVLKIDVLPTRLKYIVFDGAVNQGATTAAKLLQQACKVQVDGIVGNKTLAAIQELEQDNPDSVLETFIRLRNERYFGTRTFEHNGKGWLNRLLSATLFTTSLQD